MTDWIWPDWFSWMVTPVLVFEAIRSARIQVRIGKRRPAASRTVSAMEALLAFGCISARTPLVFLVLKLLHYGFIVYREGGIWRRGAISVLSMATAAAALAFEGHVESFGALTHGAAIDPGLRSFVIVLLVVSCVLSLLPVNVKDEAKGAHVAPVPLMAFARIAVPLFAAEPRATLIVPVIAISVALISALWLLTAGMRANHFERASLVSELLVCERGVLFSFVWLGLASGDHLAGVGAVLEWWAGALALVALENALRVKVLPKPVAFFALAMAIGLPGTVGFVAEDLLAHGLLELRPLLAAGFVAVGAVNAAALFLAIVNVVAEGGYDPRPPAAPTIGTILPAIMSVMVGLVPRPFVTGASMAHVDVGGTDRAAVSHARHAEEDYDIPPP
jgi:hypothetical protein